MSFLHFFNRLTSEEDMPPRRPLRRLRKKLSTTTLTWMFVTTWSLVTAGLLTFALVVTHTSQASEAGPQSTCTASSLLLPCNQQKAP